ncbi:SOS response-associated peptidase [Paenibacillus typhae]|uniref:SOS response-associated peptidase n=1 Tax=Paenibacillus typhae TaxID=1174501 RepID=UPI001C8E79D0|nr:SOS response-associated peptidase [Paenibacillus typhae]MBY0012842.1 SOS response-associated peptidase [Paenibacillus typhae]
MCGRYTITVSLDELMLRYFIEGTPLIHYTPKYNAAPVQQIPAVIHDGTRNRLGELRWGLVPSWSRDDKGGSTRINARAETLLEKASFKGLIRSRRCIIPADGFYEWKQGPEGKQPMRIVLPERRIFSLAGLYDIRVDEEGNRLSTCTIITTEPNSLMADIHNRMPVILTPEAETQWLDRSNEDIPSLLRLLQPYDSSQMRAYPVSAAVGNVRNDYPELIKEA